MAIVKTQEEKSIKNVDIGKERSVSYLPLAHISGMVI